MNRRKVAAKVAAEKTKHPERFCPEKRCLWRTGGGYCPRHSAGGGSLAGSFEENKEAFK